LWALIKGKGGWVLEPNRKYARLEQPGLDPAFLIGMAQERYLFRQGLSDLEETCSQESQRHELSQLSWDPFYTHARYGAARYETDALYGAESQLSTLGAGGSPAFARTY